MKNRNIFLMSVFTVILVCLSLFFVQAMDWPMYMHDSSHTAVADSSSISSINAANLTPSWNFTSFNGSDMPHYSLIAYNSSTAGMIAIAGFENSTTGNGTVIILNASTGTVLGRYNPDVGSNSGILGTGAVVNDTLFIGCGNGGLFAINITNVTNPTKLWSYDSGSWTEASPTVANGIVYISSYSGIVVAVNFTNNNTIWNNSGFGTVASSPAVVNGILYVGSDAFYALNASTGANLWNHTVESPIEASPSIANGVVYFSDINSAYALNATTGIQKWNYSISNGGIGFYASPIINNNIAYVGSNNNKVYALNASSGVNLWNYTTTGNVTFPAAATNDIITFGDSAGVLYVINASNNATLKTFNLTGGLSAPVIVGGSVYVVKNSGGDIFAFSTAYQSGGATLDVALASPVDAYTFTSSPFIFYYNVTGSGPANCSLWSNFTGVWAKNQTNIIVFMGANNFTISSLSNGSYKWNVNCTNGLNESWGVSNRTFSIDTTPPATINLGTAANFAVLAGSGITIIGAVNSTSIAGDIGTYPTPTITGFENVVLNGTSMNHADDSVTQEAKINLTAAYTDAAGRTPSIIFDSVYDLGNQTFTPGVYNDPTSLDITGTLTLDAQGNSSAVFIFQAGSTLTTAVSSNVTLINGASASNVFWQVGSSATLGAGSVFKGNILALADASLGAGASVEGRVLARTGTVNLASNQIALPQNTTSVPFNISVIKYLVNSTVNCSSTITFTINITNNNDYNLTNILVNDTGIGSSLFYTQTQSVPLETYFVGGEFVAWRINISAHNTSQILANFTTGGTNGNYTNYVRVSNSSGSMIANVSANYTIAGSCGGGGPANISLGLRLYFEDTLPIDQYVDKVTPASLFVGQTLNITGVANGSGPVNWTISLRNSSGIVNSSLCFGNYSLNGTFCNWDTTRYCAGECMNYTLVLNVTSMGNSNATSIENMTIDNTPPRINMSAEFISTGTPEWLGRANITDSYLQEVDVLIFDVNGSLIFSWNRLCNETECNWTGSGRFNQSWRGETFKLNGTIVPTYQSYLFFPELADNNLALVPGCLSVNGSESNYTCGGVCTTSFCSTYRWWLVYNTTSQDQDNYDFIGLANENECNGDGCNISTSNILNGTTRFKPQMDYLENSTWTHGNTSLEMTLYLPGDLHNLLIARNTSIEGNYTFTFKAQDYWWTSLSSITDNMAFEQILPNAQINDELQHLTINGTSYAFAHSLWNITGVANSTSFSNWTISLRNSSGTVNSSLCFGNYSVNGTFCSWNTTLYCNGECRNYTLVLNVTDTLGNKNSNNLNNLIIDNLAPAISINVSVNGSTVFARANITETYLHDTAAYILNGSNYIVNGWGRFCGETQNDSCQQLEEGTFNRTWQSSVYYLNNTLAPVNNKFGFGISDSTISIPGCFASNGTNYDCGGTCVNQSICSTYRYWLVYNDSNHNGHLLGLANEQWCSNECTINITIQNATSKFKVQMDYLVDGTWLSDNSTVVTLYNIGEQSNMNTTSVQVTNGTYKFAFKAQDYALWSSISSVAFNVSTNEGPGSGLNVSTNLILLNSGRPNIGDTVRFLINVTNAGSVNISNLTISDEFDEHYNYTNASLSPSGVDYVNHIISWNNISVNLSSGQSYLIYVNFSALSANTHAWNRINSTIYTTEGSSTNSYSLNFEIGENNSPMIMFIDATTTGAGNYSRNAIWANISVGDNSPIDTITIFLFNSTGLYNSSTNNTVNSSNAYLFVNFTNLPEGTYRLNATVNDTWNNRNSTGIRTITLDTHAPIVHLVLPLNNSYLNNGTNVSHSFNVTDIAGYSNCTMYWADYSLSNSHNTGFVIADGTAIGAGALTSSDGNVNWVVNCTDYAGNMGTSGVFNYTVDTIAPTISIISPTNRTYTNATILINISSNGNSTWFFNGTGNETYTIPTYRTFNDGTYTIIAYTNDTAGNQNSTTANITVDATSPTISIISPTNRTYTNATILINISTNGNNTWFYNGTANETYTEPTYKTFTEGDHTIIAYANDTAGNLNTTQINFSIDTIAPAITLISPINQTYNNATILINISSNGNSTWFFNGTGNETYTNPTYRTYPDGTYTIIAYTNDTAGNLNSTTANITVDATSPIFSNQTVYPSQPVNYSAGQVYYFNITLDGTQSNVGYQWNGTNYTNPAQVGNIYIFNKTGLPVGTYEYRWYANDSSGNFNQTQMYTYTINKSAPSITKLLNGNSSNLTVIYPQPVNASGNTDAGTLAIYMDGTGITNGQNYSLAAGYYRFDFNVTGNENYTNVSQTLYAVVSKASQTALLSINESTPIAYGTNINVSCNGDLFRNNTNVSSEISAAVLLGAGSYNYSCRLYEAQNYSYAENNSIFAVSQAPGNISLLLNGTAGNISLIYGSLVNASASTLYGNETVYRNGTNVTNENNANVSLAAGYYNYTAYSSGNQNYSSAAVTRYVNISKATSIMTSLLNGNSSNLTITYPQQVNASASTTGGTVSIFRNETNATNENNANVSLAAGDYIYNFNVTGNQNYSDVTTVILLVNIGKANGSVNLSLNGNSSNFSTSYPNTVNISASSSQSGSVEIYINGTNSTAENNINITRSAGYYNITASYLGNQNYTSSVIIQWLNVTKGNSNVNAYLNNSRSNLSLDIGTFGTTLVLNATLMNGTGAIYLYKNGTLINSGSSPLSNSTLFSSTGTYNITAVYSATQNYSSSSETWWVTAIDTAAPSLTILSPGNTNYFVGQLIRVNFSASDLSGVSNLWYYNTSENVPFTSDSYLNLTNGSYTFIFYANDSYNNVVNMSSSFTIEGLAANQTVLNESSVTIGTNTTEIILPTNQSVSAISIPSNRTETEPITLNLGQKIDSNGNMSFGDGVNMTRAGSLANYSVQIPSGIVISGGNNWSGDFTLPTLRSTAGLSAPSISDYTTTLEKILIVGSASGELNFSSPVKLVIGNMAGKKAAWSRGTTFTDIPVYCNNESAPTNINSSARECYTNDSTDTDLIIWTYHFTYFAAYSSTPVVTNNPGSGSSGGGGGGGGGSSTGPTQTAEYNYIWSKIVSGETYTMKINRTAIPITDIVFVVFADKASAHAKVIANLTEANISAPAPGGYVYQYMNISIDFPSSLSEATISYKVPLSWLTERNIDRKNVVLLRYSGGAWQELTTALLSSDSSYAYYSSKTPGFSIFAIGVSSGATPVASGTAVNNVSAPVVSPEAQQQPSATDTQAHVNQDAVIQSESKSNSNSDAYLFCIIAAIILVGIIIIWYMYRGKKRK